MTRSPFRRRGAPLICLLAVCVALGPGCLLGSPLAAFSGEPYGMTIDDIGALGGRNGKIWSGAPVLAFFDLPIAAVLDTGFLPIALIMWGILSLSGSGDDRDHEDRREADVHTDHQSDYTDSGAYGDKDASKERWQDRATD